METSFSSCSYVANVLFLYFLIFGILLPKGMFTLRVQCNANDRYLLLHFKHTLVDPSAILSDWTNERDCCEWTGVQCDNTTGRVIELSLPCHAGSISSPLGCDDDKSYCLTGDLSLSLLQLEFLNLLDLRFNDFRTMSQKGYEDVLKNCNNMSAVNHPHSCQNSSNLYYLYLSDNENLYVDNFQWLSCVSSLKHLGLSRIDFQKEIDWLHLASLLPSLTELSLDGCFLKNIDPHLPFVNFTSLEILGLSQNAFSTQFLPHWLFNFTDLTLLDLSNNYFQGQLPKTLLNLRKIKTLDLSYNKLSGLIPDWLGQLEHLQKLFVHNNVFSGPIPSTLGNLSSLTFLDVESNYLNDSLPESLGQLSNLDALFFYDNELSGHLTERNFVSLSKLKHLSLGSPGSIFDFHSLWVPPFQLEGLFLTNMTSPKLPPWLYTQTSLELLEIAYSTISFESKEKFWDFATHIEELRIHDNRIINGDLSNVLLNSRSINLDSNKFKSGLPRLSPNVVFFSATRNSFQGSLSPLLCQKMNERSQLRYIDLSNNFLYGGLTDCWMNWKSLVIVRLGNNNLTSTIPTSLSFLSNLTILQLNKNSLVGEIPLLLKNCQYLQILDLGENKLSGGIPNWIGHNVKVLLLRSNQLNGTIPLQICQLASLTILDLADNKISGSVPICIRNLTAMDFLPSSSIGSLSFCMRIQDLTYVFEKDASVMLHPKGQGLLYNIHLERVLYIDLSSNNMSGTIPPELLSLAELKFLNLSHNQLEGNIPKEIGSLKQLESLDLSSNRLSGDIPPSMAQLTFLGTLNLSFNNLSGIIPSGTQLGGFDAQNYIGNPELCGPPLPKKCTSKENLEFIEENNSQDEFLASFNMGLGVGFSIAFWGVCGAIFFNRNFRHSYFRFLYHIRNKLYIMVVLWINYLC